MVGTSSLALSGMYSYLLLPNVSFLDAARMLAIEFNPVVAMVSAVLSGFCASLHWYCVTDILFHSRRSISLVSPGVKHLSAHVKSPGWAKSIITSTLDSIGVRGRRFEAAFLLREGLTIAMQCVQCYRFTRTIARPSLNRLMTGLLVINCISTPMLQVFGKNRGRVSVRLACLLVDAIVDLIVSFIVPLLVLVPQFLTFLRPPQSIDLLFHDPVWYVQFQAELSVMFVNSWISCVAQYLPALTLLHSMHDIKSLMHRQSRSKWSANTLSSVPIATKHKSPSILFAHVALLLCGCIVLIVDVHSLLSPSTNAIPGCQLFLHPWFESRVACSVLLVDCKNAHMPGSAHDIAEMLEDMDSASLNAITFAHCSWLEMPRSVQGMSRLHVLEFYNTTIAQWDEEAGLDAVNNPHVTRVVIVESSLAPLDHFLPPGLLHDHLPGSLDYFIMTDTRLAEFPEDFQRHWPRRMTSLQCNNCGLTTLPALFVAHEEVSLADNNLTALPATFFSDPVPTYVNLANNQIAEVPSLANATGLLIISLQCNVVKKVDLREHSAKSKLAVAGTPYCTGKPDFEVINDTNVTCAPIEDSLFTFPKSAWMQLRGL